MAITQISNKTEITLRANLERALNHGEADQNFKQLLNVIEDVSALIQAISKVDELQTIVDNSLSGPLKKFEEQIAVMTTQVQATIESLNNSSGVITETKEIANTSHNQITKAAKTLFPDTKYADDDLNATDTLLHILEIACPKYAGSIAEANSVSKGVVNYNGSPVRFDRNLGAKLANDYTTIVENNLYSANSIKNYLSQYEKACKEASISVPSWFYESYGTLTIGPFDIVQYVEYNYVPRSTYNALEARVAELEKKLSGGSGDTSSNTNTNSDSSSSNSGSDTSSSSNSGSGSSSSSGGKHSLTN